MTNSATQLKEAIYGMRTDEHINSEHKLFWSINSIRAVHMPAPTYKFSLRAEKRNYLYARNFDIYATLAFVTGCIAVFPNLFLGVFLIGLSLSLQIIGHGYKENTTTYLRGYIGLEKDRLTVYGMPLLSEITYKLYKYCEKNNLEFKYERDTSKIENQ